MRFGVDRKLEAALGRRRHSWQKNISAVILAYLSTTAWAQNAQQTAPQGSVASLQLSPAVRAQLQSDHDTELLRRRERDRVLRKQLEPSPNSLLQEQAPKGLPLLPQNEPLCFTIRRIVLAGERSAAFQWALSAANPPHDHALGRCLGTQGINLVMARIQNAIIARGYVTTRVLASSQDLKTGVLRLTLIPGIIGHIRFADGTPKTATEWNAIPAHPGDLLNLRAIEQGLENFKRVPTADADIQIVPSTDDQAHPGQSDLLIRWSQSRQMRWNLSLDDSGSQTTGRLQAAISWSLDDALHLNDLFYINLNHDAQHNRYNGTHGITAHYSVPWGYWLFALTITHYAFAQPILTISPRVRYSGKSRNDEFRVSRVMWRTARSKSGMYGRLWQRSSRNYLADTQINIQHRRMAGWELGLTHRQFFGKATLDASAGIRHGTGALGALHAPEERLDEGTSRPQFYVADAQFAMPLSWGKHQLQYTSEWRGQWNHTRLVPQDRLAIGGRYTVRGFDGENVLIGEHGWLLRNDLSLNLGAGQSFYVAVDTGHVGGHFIRAQSGRLLTGAAIGLRGGWKNVYWDLFVGAALRHPRGFVSADTTSGLTLNAAF